MPNPLLEVQKFGQSIWYDYIRRNLITSGELRGLIQNDGLRGITSNPSIFEKAIAGSTDYDEALKRLVSDRDLDAKELYERLAIEDIQMAADAMQPVYEQTQRRDGYVSLEVSPYLADDTAATIEEARRLWKTVGRPNLMVKVPATPAGIPAIRTLIGEGINVNVTLLFHVDVYEGVAKAYMAGLEDFVAKRGDASGIASVASFFVSRIDSMVDALIPDKKELQGKVAIANAKSAYQRYKTLTAGARWKALAAKGAQTQRLLWASTSAKNPNYRDVMYVEELIGQDTVDTVPAATVDAFRQHGQPRAALEEGAGAASATLQALAKAGVSLDDVCDKLLEAGVRLFTDAFDKLLSAVEQKREAVMGRALDRQAYRVPAEAEVKNSLEEWRAQAKVRRLWARDATLWTGKDEAQWLGWLNVIDDQGAHLDHLRQIADEVHREGFEHALLLGMGGSSLCPEVFRMTFGRNEGFPELHVLDSTDPAQIKRFENAVNLKRTLFIVSSKSGTTLEPNILMDYFFDRVHSPQQFIAITDPGSAMQKAAEERRFRRVFFGWPSIGGRYSAMSDFGLVPAAVMGIDVAKFLGEAERMVHSCASCVPPADNPGAVLGTILGVLAKQGRDKVTIVASPGLSAFGTWLEQLLAESTGKQSKGLIPVDRETLGRPEVYGADRVFAYLRLESSPDAAQDAAVDALEKAGQPVVRFAVGDAYDLGEEMFRWEFATAVAGSVIGINAFDQPDVEASKTATRELTAQFEKTGALPKETPALTDRGVQVFADAKNARAAVGKTLAECLRAHLGRLGAGDYFAVLAYLDRNAAHDAILQGIRHAVRDAKRVATCLGFGPRFLHSTGQAYKGGPNSGVFLQITGDDAVDLPVPGRKYSFGVVKAAQARGDLQVLVERDRRVLRIHLGKDTVAGLGVLKQAVVEALARR